MTERIIEAEVVKQNNADNDDGSAVPAIVKAGGDNLMELAKQAKERVKALLEIKAAALEITKDDWMDEGGKPYLEASGAEKIASIFQVSWELDKPEFSEDGPEHYYYTVAGKFRWRTVEITAYGSRSSRDPFFSKRRVWNEAKQKSESQDKPVDQIDKGDVMKAAITNCIANGIGRLLGLRNMTWEELERMGIKRNESKSVSFKKRPAPPAAPVKPPAETPNGNATPETVKKVENPVAKVPNGNTKTVTIDELKREAIALISSKGIPGAVASAICEPVTGEASMKKWTTLDQWQKAVDVLKAWKKPEQK